MNEEEGGGGFGLENNNVHRQLMQKLNHTQLQSKLPAKIESENIQQSQYTYNVTSRRGHETTLTMEKQ
jgi:hypothetical protein